MTSPAGEILNRKIADGASVAQECGEIEESIAALRMSYEQYFLGMERRPPTLAHNEVKKRLQTFKGAFIRQTALRFRIQALQAKLTTYERLWTRTLQEIENGTYRRDLFKAKLHAKERELAKAKKAHAGEHDDDDDDEDTLPPMAREDAAPRAKPAAAKPVADAAASAPAAASTAARPTSRPASAPARPSAAAAAAENGGLSAALSDQKLKQVFDAYMQAKRRCQEDVSKLSFDQVAANLRKQVPDLVKKAGAQGVEFKVIIKDGKAILRALPK